MTATITYAANSITYAGPSATEEQSAAKTGATGTPTEFLSTSAGTAQILLPGRYTCTWTLTYTNTSVGANFRIAAGPSVDSVALNSTGTPTVLVFQAVLDVDAGFTFPRTLFAKLQVHAAGTLSIDAGSTMTVEYVPLGVLKVRVPQTIEAERPVLLTSKYVKNVAPATSHVIALGYDVPAGAVLVVNVRESPWLTPARVTSISGCGATWTQVSSPPEDDVDGSFPDFIASAWVGAGATGGSVITLTSDAPQTNEVSVSVWFGALGTDSGPNYDYGTSRTRFSAGSVIGVPPGSVIIGSICPDPGADQLVVPSGYVSDLTNILPGSPTLITAYGYSQSAITPYQLMLDDAGGWDGKFLSNAIWLEPSNTQMLSNGAGDGSTITGWHDPLSNTTTTTSTTRPRTGARSFRQVIQFSDTLAVLESNQSDGGGAGSFFTVSPGDSFVLRGWGSTDAGWAPQGRAVITFYASGGGGPTRVEGPMAALSGTYTEFTVSGTAPPGATNMRVQFETVGTLSPGNIVRWDDLLLVPLSTVLTSEWRDVGCGSGDGRLRMQLPDASWVVEICDEDVAVEAGDLVFADDFDRPDGPLGTGWLAAGWLVDAAAAAPTAGGGPALRDVGVQYVDVTWNFQDFTNDDRFYVAASSDGAYAFSVSRFDWARLDPAGNTVIGFSSPIPTTATRLRVVLEPWDGGSEVVEIHVDDVLFYSTSAHGVQPDPSHTHCGFWSGTYVDTTLRVDDISVTALDDVGGPIRPLKIEDPANPGSWITVACMRPV